MSTPTTPLSFLGLTLLLAAPARGQITVFEAADRPVLKAASCHPIKYFLSLPQQYRRTPGKRWPVLFCIDCAGSNFRALAETFRKGRGDLGVLVVAPCTFSSTNAITGHMRDKYRRLYSDALIDSVRRPDSGLENDLAWDEAGVLAIIADLRRDYDIEDRVYMMGFSGGGLLTYRMIFKHPSLLGGAAVMGGNFFGPDYRALQGRFTADDLNFPVRLILGERDHNRASTKASWLFSTSLQECSLAAGLGLAGGLLLWWLTGQRRWLVPAALASLLVIGAFQSFRQGGLDAQTGRAAARLRELGYPNVRRTLVPGMGHEGRPAPVVEAFRPYWLGEKKRGDSPADKQ